ncbi:Sodium:solute symporter family [Cardinium endosymbiont of Sogatella furcifera]|uniref:sodium:solute symporter family protein n=1 Tax=Cardinium endosymbiont of Sogatella furcifera TaxID=650378 RepID=UPI000E0D4FBC|nr:sodium:solute symporter family protein [Cardinium endosymbiont of Sogatella furcifera]AXI24268.1 Sodium:solute symporter family [Cardinium endosymbiont of Sogatella furcifera]
MLCLNISLFIVAIFLLLTLVVGIYFSRKKTTFREYAVGNKQFATATLVATVLATLYAGCTLMCDVECVYEYGLWWIVLVFLDCFGLWTIGKLALRMGPFMQHFSIAQTMGHVYGRYARIVTALVGTCRCIIIITMQITVMSRSITMCVHVDNPYLVPIFASLFLVFYSTFGGVRAVTFTDILQFLTFSIIIPLLTWFIFLKAGKPVSTIIPILHNQAKFQFSTLFHFDTKLIALFSLILAVLVSYIVQPQLMQRVYMSSGTIQAQKVFSYATVFNLIIASFIILIGLFVFVGAPHLSKEEVWGYIMTHMSPFFKGFLAVSLLAMAMSTADSCLNACSIMISYDILQSIHKEKQIDDAHQLKIARWTTLVLGLLAMMLAFYCQDLLKLTYWVLDSAIPVITAPFILAIFGFRGTTRTALIGMATGALTILAWNKWIEPLDPEMGINGAFPSMLANGLAMLAAHYLFKQPKEAGWVGPDPDFKQMQQAHARKQAERKEAIKNGWANRKITLANLIPNHTMIICVGIYIAVTSLLAYFIAPIAHHVCWLILQLFGAACYLGYPFLYDIFQRIRDIPSWFIGLCWLVGLAVYLPLNLLGTWWYLTEPIFSASLSLAHCGVILWGLPLYLGIGVATTTLLISIYPIATGPCFPLLSSLLPLCIVSLLLLFAIIIFFKIKQDRYIAQILYLKNQEKIAKDRKLKASLYDSAMVPTTTMSQAKGYGAILTQVIGKIEESISFLDSNVPLYKQDFQSIINKLYDWVAYFNRRAKAKKHALLQPAQITFDQLMRKVELALSQEVIDPPRLLVEKIMHPNGGPCPHIVCDINQIVYLLVQAVLRIGKLEDNTVPIVKVQLHGTTLQFKQADPIDSSCPVYMLFQATALVFSQATTSPEALPKVQGIYDDGIDAIDDPGKQAVPPSIDLQQETISSIVGAHYGHLEICDDKQQPTMLLVLPNDVTDMLSKMTAKLPLDCLTSETPVTPKEQADSMMALMQFHDYICQSSHRSDPIDLGTISGLLLLLRKHFGFKRHASGQLFYVRAVGITTLIVEWVFHSPKVIYAALLYELVRHTCLPLSYVKEHYNLGVYAFVLNVISIDKRQDLDHPSLLYVQNRLKEAIKEEHIQLSVLFIKLAERLYDLHQAASYIHPTEVHHMAQETLDIDVKLAHTYLGPEIGTALEHAAKEALKIDIDKDTVNIKKGKVNKNK